jgi:hypothetical protein
VSKKRGGYVMKLYHVVVDSSTAELEVIREVKPPKLLLSYFYFKNKQLKEYIEKIGYHPEEILLDSGAYSAWTKGKNISPIDYMNYIATNAEYITEYIMIDVIGEPDLTLKYYEIMKLKGLNPIPVFHYGLDETYLKLYIAEGNDHIALGNTVPVKDKSKVAEWVNDLIKRYPNVKFHLLGSSSDKITKQTDVYSCDSSTWFMQAIMGKPKHIKGTSRKAKMERAKYNLINELEEMQ